MYVGLLCDVGRLVAMQPPWSMATSMITLPGFMRRRSSCSTSIGAFAPGISTAPITRSALRQLLADRVAVAEQAVRRWAA